MNDVKQRIFKRIRYFIKINIENELNHFVNVVNELGEAFDELAISADSLTKIAP